MNTPRECARLMGFPNTFKIPVSDTQAYRQFGNSVVVPVIKSIASLIEASLAGKTPSKGGAGDDEAQLKLPILAE